MRTKTLLLTATFVVAGVATSMAQSNVYSQNIVGYVNITVKPGYNLITLPLLGSDPLSHINSVLTNTSVVGFPQASGVYTWSPTLGGFNSEVFSGGDNNWYQGDFVTLATNQLPPGLGFFLQNGEGSNYTITVVGTVLTGTNTYPVNQGFGFYGNLVSESVDVTTTGFPIVDGSGVLSWSATSQSYNPEYFGLGTDDSQVSGGTLTGNPGTNPVLTFDFVSPVVYTPAIGEGFIYVTGVNPNNNQNNPATTWTDVFNVQ